VNKLFTLQKKLIPDVLDVMANRYRILRAIEAMQPVGRRALTNHLGLTERMIRSEVTFLSKQGLLETASDGMRLTSDGGRLVNALKDIMDDVSGFAEMEKQLRVILDISRVIIVPGDSDEDPWVKNEMGLAGVKVMEECIHPNSIIAVTGGTTMAAVAEMTRPLKKGIHPLFVSARGGLGERVENQANTICAKMAEKADGTHRLLHVPDPLSEESYQSLIEEPSIREVVDLIRRADIVIHGIGDAKTMASRRKTAPEIWEKIEREQAVAEAFGYYFDRAGRIVHKVKTIGLRLEDLYDSRTVLAVAGGKSKAAAIEAYFKRGPNSILVTDEAAAAEIIHHHDNFN